MVPPALLQQLSFHFCEHLSLALDEHELILKGRDGYVKSCFAAVLLSSLVRLIPDSSARLLMHD